MFLINHDESKTCHLNLLKVTCLSIGTPPAYTLKGLKQKNNYVGGLKSENPNKKPFRDEYLLTIIKTNTQMDGRMLPNVVISLLWPRKMICVF